MRDVKQLSVQEKYAPNSICFGCGPANEKGLQIRSFRTDNGLEMIFETKKEHQAFPGIINGGIIINKIIKERTKSVGYIN